MVGEGDLLTSEVDSADSTCILQFDRDATSQSAYSRCWSKTFTGCIGLGCKPKSSVRKTIESCFNPKKITKKVATCSAAATLACRTEKGGAELYHCKKSAEFWFEGRGTKRDRRACREMRSRCKGRMPCNACDCKCKDTCCPTCKGETKCCENSRRCVPNEECCPDQCFFWQRCCKDKCVGTGECCDDCGEGSCCNGQCIGPNECCEDCGEGSCCNGQCIGPNECCEEDCGEGSCCNGQCIGPNDCCDCDGTCCAGGVCQSECCPEDPCCGSSDPCCGSTDPCCGSDDNCCAAPEGCDPCNAGDPCPCAEGDYRCMTGCVPGSLRCCPADCITGECSDSCMGRDGNSKPGLCRYPPLCFGRL